MTQFKVGDKVFLKESYSGYFESFKGKELTIQKYFRKDQSLDADAVSIAEFQEINLILITDIERQANEKT